MQRKYFMATGASIIGLAVSLWYINRDDGKIPVDVNGVNHMGHRYSVAQYYVDGFYASNIGREGGGGSHTCCMVLPGVWRPGMQVDLRWEVYDHEKKSFTRFKAKVPVEKYDVVGEIVIHIFRDNSARFVSSIWSVSSENHPVAWGESDGGALASKGREIAELFSIEELRKFAERDGPRGSWR